LSQREAGTWSNVMLRSPWNPAAILLILLMAAGSIVMWLGVPLGLIYAASKLSGSSSPSVGPYLLVFIGLPIGMALVGKLLGYLDRAHSRLTGRDDGGPHRATWLKSMRAERTSNRRGGVLDKVMIVSVGLAIVVFAVWFFGFAGSSLPGT
jgi:succinate dehydrogenase hydrophobic anchor subunit